MVNFVINEYKLDITPQGNYPVVYLSQYEDGRDIKFYMLNRGYPLEIPQSGISVFVSGLKANGGYFEHSCDVVDDSEVIMHIESDMTDVSGRGAATLTFTDLENKKVISAKFIINVQDGVSDGGIEIPTEAETIFQQLLDEIRSEAAKLDLDMDALDEKIEEFKADVNADVTDFKEDVTADMDSFKSDVNDDIDVINARMDNFLASQTGVSNGEKFTITPLYSAPTDGSVSSYVTLSDDPINYPYLIIQFGIYTSGTSGYKTVDRAIVSGSDFRAATQANPFICNSLGVFDNASEGGTRYYPLRAVQLSMWKYTTGETQYKAYRSRFDSLDWSGMGSQDAYGYTGSGNDFIVRAVYGIKFVDAGTSKDPELADIRIGADGYSYPSAGAAVRLQISQIKEDLSDIHVETEIPINLWVQGTIILDTGEVSSSPYRCRSYGYFTSRDLGYGTAKITIKSGLRLMGVAWDEKMEYAGSISDDWVTGELTFEVKEGWSYRFIASKPSGSGGITPSECVDAFYIVKSGMTDDTLNVSGKSADARAVKESLMPSTSSFNSTSTIVAAKYFNYADGTQPVIDWYLLADYAGYIYISKDLKSKKYICKFPYWFQYKFAVRQNGDIIAVYRTELLSKASEATYDSSLDDCRKNPLVCLYSEGYAEWHEVDFGASLKPTGWLENCGIEVLPNGDIIFGEYTRMMVVYTANLWRIRADADITSPSSWEVLKSYHVAQNDTDTYDETVIEHFHTVQTDPYTGTVYYATGDTGNKSQIWYSTDSGDYWTQQTFVDPDTSQTVTSGEKFFRLLNYNFTATTVYWSSDSGTEHAILKAERNGADGFVPNSIRIVTEIATAAGKPATYGSVLYEDKKIMVLMERCDSNATQMLFRAYDLVTNTLKTICTIKCAVNEAKNIGFRTLYTEFEPLDGIIKCGFGTHRYYMNYNAICGNKGTEFINNVNTLNIRISMDAERNIYARFGTYYI